MSSLKDMVVAIILAPKLHSVHKPRVLVNILNQVLCSFKPSKALTHLACLAKIGLCKTTKCIVKLIVPV